MTDPTEPSRPARPQYGEYASPEEQRRRIQQPDATWALETGHAVEAAGESAGASAGVDGAPAGAPPAAADSTGVGATAGRAPGRRLADRIVTIGLLVYGLFAVVTAVPSMLDYAGYANMLLGLWGVDFEYTGGSTGALWGAAAAFVFVGGWLATAWLSWRRLSRGRVAWWIPLVGGVVCTILASLFLGVPLVSDPALREVLMNLV